MDFINKILELFNLFNKHKNNVDKVVKGVQKVQSGLSTSFDVEPVTECRGTYAGKVTVSSRKDVEIEKVLFSFNQYITKYTGAGGKDYKWKEYFIGTQTADGFSLKQGETKVMDFAIDFECEMRDDEKKDVDEKGAKVKDIIKRAYFRQKGTGMGTEWSFKLVVVYTLAGGEEIKEIKELKIK
ncbi:MAG TPA: hypothetical protein PKA32_03325 [Candidatus Gracilibacteria bacterium]|nr:hypothetical protein [Candidatus Gracilibacteria bacterium]